MQELQLYIAKETLVSFLANALINTLVIWAVFWGRSAVPLLGRGGIAIDFIPQLGAITLIGYIVPTILTRSRLKTGKIRSAFGATPIGFLSILRDSAVAAVGIALGLGIVTTVVLWVLYPGPYSFAEVLAIKSIIGCAVPFAITPAAIRRAFLQEPRV